jgi:MerR family transcriptional regulator, heat shock protein HspR
VTDDHPRYTISIAAELAGMHPQTLRVYEARGLVRPRRTPGGTRRYSDADLARLRKIAELTSEHGVNLTGAELVLGLEDRVRELTALVGQLQSQLVQVALEHKRAVEGVHRSYRRDLVPYIPPTHPTPRITQDPWTSRS